MSETTPNQGDRSRKLLFILLGLTLVLTAALVCAVFLFLHYRQTRTDIVDAPAAIDVAQDLSQAEDYARSNSVSLTLGGDERSHGLTHNPNEKDGLTVIEPFDGVPARALRLGPHNRTTLNFYFQIDPGFKQNDLSQVRFEVEYLDPEPGTMGIHYDAHDADNVDNAKYRDANPTVRLSGSKAWRRSTFRTQGDAIFNNRQNGWSDFRIWATTPLLYVRRVVVTRESLPGENWKKQFSTSNQVSVLLGREQPEEAGLRHLAEADGASTSIQTMAGVPCRYLNRMTEGRMFGSLYFAINPSFKREGLKNALVEIEYLAKKDTSFRLQFDGLEGDTHRLYLPVLPEGAQVMRFGTGADYATTPTPGVWSVATFHLTNAVFMNSQKDGADFRLEVVPPEIYVRRVTVTREN